MPSILKVSLFWAALLLTACGPNTQVPTSASAIVGTKAIVKYHRSELVAEITDVTGKLVTTEFSNWDGELVFSRTEYRGLVPISGSDPGAGQWELDFDENQLEALFPLQPGKEVAFKGNLKNIDKGTSYDLWAQLEVIGEKVLDLPSGRRKVMVVEFNRQGRRGNQTKHATDIIYFDPEYSMTLKKVMREKGSQSYWRVISIDRPGNVSPTPTRQRRSGTVMI